MDLGRRGFLGVVVGGVGMAALGGAPLDAAEAGASIEIVLTNGARTTLSFDNLLDSMRGVYYMLLARGITPTGIVAGREVMYGYDSVSGQHDPPVSTFKGVPLRLDTAVNPHEMQFMWNRNVVGRIVGIS